MEKIQIVIIAKAISNVVTNVTKKQFMSEGIQALKTKQVSPKSGGRGRLHKDEPRDKVVRIRSSLFNEMIESELARRFNVDFDDICSEVWEFWKKEHKKK